MKTINPFIAQTAKDYNMSYAEVEYVKQFVFAVLLMYFLLSLMNICMFPKQLYEKLEELIKNRAAQ